LAQSSLFYLILFYFVIIESATFGYRSSWAYIYIGNKDKTFEEYRNSDGVVISVEVDMNKFLFLFILFLFCFYFIYIHLTILIMNNTEEQYISFVKGN
jgi:putative flippase GtrA